MLSNRTIWRSRQISTSPVTPTTMFCNPHIKITAGQTNVIRPTIIGATILIKIEERKAVGSLSLYLHKELLVYLFTKTILKTVSLKYLDNNFETSNFNFLDLGPRKGREK